MTMNNMGPNGQMSSFDRMDWEPPGNDRSIFSRGVFKRINLLIGRIKRRRNQNSMRPRHDFRRDQKDPNFFNKNDMIF